MKAAIVVPTIREESITKFLEVWRDQFAGHTVIIVEDNPEPSFDFPKAGVKHFSWKDIDADLGEHSWIIPRRTDCIRSYGLFKACQESVDMIVTLDDDCYPSVPDFLKIHSERLTSSAVSQAWVSTVEGAAPRGMPYQNILRECECVLNHGLWTKVPDLDAITQLAQIRVNGPIRHLNQVIPRGSYFPMCGMNLAFNPKITPAMYFLLMGQPVWPFDRYGDIWCGIFIKKICDHLGFGVKSGDPTVEHQRASNVWVNLSKELPGYQVNETLWKAVDSIDLRTKDGFKDCYAELSEKLPPTGQYWDRLKQAMKIWTDLF